MTGPEITWTEGSPRRPRHRAGKLKWPLRPRLAPKPAPAQPTICTSVVCPNVHAPVLPGRYVCADCAASLAARGAAHRERAK